MPPPIPKRPAKKPENMPVNKLAEKMSGKLILLNLMGFRQPCISYPYGDSKVVYAIMVTVQTHC